MKKLSILTTGFLMIFAFATVTVYTSCTDPCKDVTCLNAGTCLEGTCSCDTGYEGEDCGTEIRTKFTGSWNAAENCSSGTYSYTATVSTSSAGVTKIVLTNFGGFGTSFTLVGEISGSTISITNQTVSGITFSNASGTLSASGTQLTWSYSADDGTTFDTCTGTWTKI